MEVSICSWLQKKPWQTGTKLTGAVSTTNFVKGDHLDEFDPLIELITNKKPSHCKNFFEDGSHIKASTEELYVTNTFFASSKKRITSAEAQGEYPFLRKRWENF